MGFDDPLQWEMDRLRELGYEPVLVAFQNAKHDVRTISSLKKDELESFVADLAREPFERVPEVGH